MNRRDRLFRRPTATDVVVLPAPTFTSVTPDNGTTAGGTSLAIVGDNYVSGCTATVGGNDVGAVTFTDAQHLSFTAPAHAAGATDIVISNPDGQSVTATGAYTYAAPTVTGLVHRIYAKVATDLFQDTAGTTPVAVTNDPCARANDTTGTNANSLQTTAWQRPLWKTNQLNGHPALVADGSNDYLLATAVALGSHECTIFVVGKSTSTDGSFVYYGSYGANSTEITAQADKPSWISQGATILELTDITNDVVILCITVSTGATPTVRGYLNNVEVAASPATGAGELPSTDDLYDFVKNAFLAGAIGERRVYNRVLSAGDRTTVYDELVADWA